MRPSKKGGKRVYVCPSCGYIVEATIRSGIYVGSIDNSRRIKKEIVVVGEEASLSKVSGVKCPNCGFNEAYWWMVQTRSADEAPTTFYKCVRCGHVWRDYR